MAAKPSSLGPQSPFQAKALQIEREILAGLDELGQAAKPVQHRKKTGLKPVVFFCAGIICRPDQSSGLCKACGSDFGLADRPLASKSLKIVQALEQVCAQWSDGVAFFAMAKQSGSAQFFDASV